MTSLPGFGWKLVVEEMHKAAVQVTATMLAEETDWKNLFDLLTALQMDLLNLSDSNLFVPCIS